jgi:hypothetical protein
MSAEKFAKGDRVTRGFLVYTVSDIHGNGFLSVADDHGALHFVDANEILRLAPGDDGEPVDWTEILGR